MREIRRKEMDKPIRFETTKIFVQQKFETDEKCLIEYGDKRGDHKYEKSGY